MVLSPEAGLVRSSLIPVVMLLEFVMAEDAKGASKTSLWPSGVLSPHSLRTSVSEIDPPRVICNLWDFLVVIGSMIRGRC